MLAIVASLILLSQLHSCLASERRFDVKDDIYAFPQYDVAFPGAYILEEDAITLLDSNQQYVEDGVSFSYEYVVGNGKPYLCAIPYVELKVNETDDNAGQEAEHDLVAAASRGWQLLKDMEGQECLFYTTGWWSYKFCYNSEVKQYHGVQPSGQRTWPPAEDPSTPSYILGNYKSVQKKKAAIETGRDPKPGDLQTQSETTFLVQNLDGGTPCDLTGKPRRIEVQYHCKPGAQDSIGWIKETATCAYQMIVYTSRLCNDAVFQPPKEAHVNKIPCQQILTEADVEEWADSSAEAAQIDDGTQQRIMVGKIELGGKKLVGADGKKIERGRVVLTPEEAAEIVVMQKDGLIQGLSAAQLKKLDLSPEEVAEFQKEIQQLAGGNDWKIERLGVENGQLQLRGVVDAKKKGKTQKEPQTAAAEDDASEDEDAEAGSEEQFKQEI